jgi:hypothetical protein
MAEILHLRPADVDDLTVEDFDQALHYLTQRGIGADGKRSS